MRPTLATNKGSFILRCPTLSELPPPPPGKVGWPWTQESAQLPDTKDDGRAWPRISIVTPSYNQGQYIEETIRSVLLQGYPDLEYVVMDAASTDGTMEVVQKYRNWIHYSESKKDKGQSDALNRGFSQTSGALLGWMCSDDVFMPDTLAKVANEFTEPFDQKLIIAGMSEYRDSSGTITKWEVKDTPKNIVEIFSICTTKYFAQPSTFFSRTALESAGKISERLQYCMDLDLWLRLAQISEIKTINTKLSWMRMHDESKTVRDELKTLQAIEFILADHSGLVDSVTYEKAQVGCKIQQAKSLTSAALIALKGGDRAEAWRDLRLAFGISRRVIFTRGWIGVVLRLLGLKRA